MGGRKRTQDDTPEGLTPQQCTAVDCLVSGRTISEAAEAIGVGRPTLSEWVNHHPGFIAALNARRQELWDGPGSSVARALCRGPWRCLKAEWRVTIPLPAALAILKSCGLAAPTCDPPAPRPSRPWSGHAPKRDIERAQHGDHRGRCGPSPSAPGSSSGCSPS